MLREKKLLGHASRRGESAPRGIRWPKPCTLSVSCTSTAAALGRRTPRRQSSGTKGRPLGGIQRPSARSRPCTATAVDSRAPTTGARSSSSAEPGRAATQMPFTTSARSTSWVAPACPVTLSSDRSSSPRRTLLAPTSRAPPPAPRSPISRATSGATCGEWAPKRSARGRPERGARLRGTRPRRFGCGRPPPKGATRGRNTT
mmetsp:Transcript_32566/g.73571  ORF Transcript_32566/g.73571 Transcript_32566/m.73571 type:complete len:202 (+) Transcript_32566:368-973(+)